MNTERFTRRSSLARLGGALAAAAGGRALLSAGRRGRQQGRRDRRRPVRAHTRADRGPVLHRRARRFAATSREGHPGTLLTLRLRVLNASTCTPIKGAAVDIWHADAAGNYSGFGAGASSRTFLRGIQKTDAKGLAIFTTIYPGWYQGRTVHIHVKVHVGGQVVHTGQLFFTDSLTDAVYRRAPYSSRPNRDVRNAQDSIFVNGGKRGLLAVAKSGAGYVGTIAMGVHK